MQEAGKLSNIKWLAQGTIYPGRGLESASASHTGKAHVNKSPTHNVGGFAPRSHETQAARSH